MSIVRSMRGERDNDPAFGTRMHATGPVAQLIRQRFQLACRQARLSARASGSEFRCRRIFSAPTTYSPSVVAGFDAVSSWSHVKLGTTRRRVRSQSDDAATWHTCRAHRHPAFRALGAASMKRNPHDVHVPRCRSARRLHAGAHRRVPRDGHPHRQGRAGRHPRQAADRRRGRRRRFHGLRQATNLDDGRNGHRASTTTTTSSTRCFPGSSRAPRRAKPRP